LFDVTLGALLEEIEGSVLSRILVKARYHEAVQKLEDAYGWRPIPLCVSTKEVWARVRLRVRVRGP